MNPTLTKVGGTAFRRPIATNRPTNRPTNPLLASAARWLDMHFYSDARDTLLKSIAV